MNADSASIGFVISMKENNEAYNEIVKMNRTNFMIDSWVPQKGILALSKTKLFLSHCGGNSIMESLYFGVPLLGFPQAKD